MHRVAIVLGFLVVAVLFSGRERAHASASLDPCPQSPNCVSSLEPQDRENHVEPLAFDGPPDVAWQVLQDTLPAAEGFYEILWAGGEKLHAVFKTSLFGFKDDVTFLLDAENSVVHVRSASRIGWFDLGANRKRVQTIRDALPAPFITSD